MRTPRRCESLALLWSIACASRQAASTREPTDEPTPSVRTTAPSKPPRHARAKRSEWGRPEIERVELTSPTAITLSFSEPVVPSPGFDPSQFRLSVGAHYSEPGYSMTYYYDVGQISGVEGAAAFIRMGVLDDTTLQLELASPLDGDACESETYDDEDAKGVMGLFLHFDRRDDEGIVDRDGNHLKDIAEAWVARGAEEATYYGARSHRIRALGPIACAGELLLTHTPRP